eukprot:13422996-Ditylum_brightwellii.AAC.1
MAYRDNSLKPLRASTSVVPPGPSPSTTVLISTPSPVSWVSSITKSWVAMAVVSPLSSSFPSLLLSPPSAEA